MRKSLIPVLITILLIHPVSIKAQKTYWQFDEKGLTLFSRAAFSRSLPETYCLDELA